MPRHGWPTALLCAALALACAPAWAQADHRHGGHDHHRHASPPPPAQTPPDDADPHAHHQHHQHDAGQAPHEPIPELTDADRAAAFPALTRHMDHARELNFRALFDRFEWQDADGADAFAWEHKTWVGTDLDRLWIRSKGEHAGGGTHSADLSLLYGRGLTPWWDVLAGLRHEFAPGPSRTWAAAGVQGLAPYWFEISALAYLGESGHTRATVEVEYEILFTNRLILQPAIELELHGRDDPGRRIGAGLSKAEAGLRLRYEISRRFAPYVGIVGERTYGRTADFRRQAGHEPRDTRVVAGVRWWF